MRSSKLRSTVDMPDAECCPGCACETSQSTNRHTRVGANIQTLRPRLQLPAINILHVLHTASGTQQNCNTYVTSPNAGQRISSSRLCAPPLLMRLMQNAVQAVLVTVPTIPIGTPEHTYYYLSTAKAACFKNEMHLLHTAASGT
jgi:hypothetical protein